MSAENVIASASGDTQPGTMSAAATTDTNIRDALAKLDPANDEHWTKDGLPAMEAVNALLPAPITRERLSTVAPDFVRQAISAGEFFSEPTAEEKLEAVAGRVTALEEDNAFLRKTLGWPTK